MNVAASPLTPKEWEDREFYRSHLVEEVSVTQLGFEGVLVSGSETGSVTVPATALHGLAAFALAGQRFGFRREDVETIEELVHDLQARDPSRAGYLLDVKARMLDLQERIASLLPPPGWTPKVPK